MVCVQINLLAARYHATAWGRAANEGEAEWPPSPWRLGRALVSAWWRTPEVERADQQTVNSLLEALSRPPRFLLPRAAPGHTRHYMPRPSDERPTLVLDPFVRTDGTAVAVIWDDVELTPDQRELLGRLIERIGYIGRAEAPCLIHLQDQPQQAGIDVRPLSRAGAREGDEIVRVLCLAEDITLEALSEPTAARRRRRLVAPASGRFISYLRPRWALEPPRVRPLAPVSRDVVALRFAVEGAAVPPITEALRFAERYRAAALSRAKGKPQSVIARLRGRGDEAEEMMVGHLHAHYLPTDEDGDRRIDHLTIWCPAGIDQDLLETLDVTTLSSWAFEHPLRLVLLELIPPSNMARGPLARARIWHSHTPFLPVRHPKARRESVKDSYVEQVALELERRRLPRPVAIRSIRTGSRAWGEFRRERDRREPRAGLPALGFEIEFEEPIAGPIALGRNSHFGMGLFLPADR